LILLSGFYFPKCFEPPFSDWIVRFSCREIPLQVALSSSSF